jgi:hypothetical protein
MGMMAAWFMTTMGRKDFSKRDTNRANVPIQGHTVFAKSNGDWNVVYGACTKAQLPEATHKRAW